MIPKRLIRVVPAGTPRQVEDWWNDARVLHSHRQGWEHVTLREPHDPQRFPMTSPYWRDCQTGAQLADLVRAEELYHRGGVYIDSDIEVWRPFDPLLELGAFAGYEDKNRVCNAVMGFPAKHWVLRMFLTLAIDRRHRGTETAGVATFTEVVTHPGAGVTLLPPGAFYPVHWSQQIPKDTAALRVNNPWSYCLHHWAKSWLPK